MSAFDGLLRARPDGGTEALLPTPTVQCHAANLAFLPNGDLACVWFGGTQEGVSDISIYLSRLVAGTDRWLSVKREGSWVVTACWRSMPGV